MEVQFCGIPKGMQDEIVLKKEYKNCTKITKLIKEVDELEKDSSITITYFMVGPDEDFKSYYINSEMLTINDLIPRDKKSY